MQPLNKRLLTQQSAGTHAADPTTPLGAALRASTVQAYSGLPLINGAAVPGGLRTRANRSHVIVAGVIRNYNDGRGWVLIDDGFHPSINITGVDSLTDAGLIRVNYTNLKVGGGNAGRTVTLIAQPDETLAKAGFTCGASVSPDFANIQLQQTRSLNDYVYWDTASGTYKLWRNEFGDGSPFTIGTTTSNHLQLTHPQAVIGDRFDFGVDRVGGPAENYLPVLSTNAQANVLTQMMLDFYTDGSSAATRVTTPDTKCRAYVRRGMVRSYVKPADVNETTYPSGNIWILGIMQDQNLG